MPRSRSPLSFLFSQAFKFQLKKPQLTRNMATPSNMNEDLKAFHDHLKNSKRVLALLGAGISASSGLATFRGPGGMWRNHRSQNLATPGAFEENPALVWQFYSYRRHKSLQASPNAAHYALAELARKMPAFLTLSQNVDGLSPLANHPANQLKLLHGNLFNIRCQSRACGYTEKNFNDPIVPALEINDGHDPTTNEALDISDASVPINKIAYKDLPHCPKCKERLLRPDVVWFGETLPRQTLVDIDEYLAEPADVDLIMVIGTSAKIFPAAGYIQQARDRGARVCVVNMDADDAPPGGWEEGDWFFQGDAAQIVPKLLEPVIGEVKVPSTSKV